MPRAGITPQAIFDAAANLANRAGLEAVTLAGLAATFGVKPPSLYKHVDGLDAVRRALAVRGIEEANRRIQRATIGKARAAALFPPPHAYWHFARDEPGLYAASLRAAAPGEKDVAQAGDALIGTVLAVLGGYGIKGDDALHATRGLRAIIHGFVSLDAAGGFKMKLDLKESFDRLLGAFARDLDSRS